MLRPVDLGLNHVEVEFILQGLEQWNGRARPMPQSAQLVGYDSSEAMVEGSDQMHAALASGATMSRRDWKRALIATELIFGSDAFGAGVERRP